jgi:GMP synthase (glutamine-hydrolysing)
MMRTVTAIRHVPFEDLGVFDAVFRDAGFAVQFCEAGMDDLGAIDPSTAIVVILGAPIGAYEEDKYPFLLDELRLLERRLSARRPTLGICLGAQLIARALGSRVYPGARKEIGWGQVDLTPEGRRSPLQHLQDVPVLHWHGDTFDLPAGAQRLASTAVTENQAFGLGPAILALQFHPEVEARNFERWLIGHTLEISAVPDLSVDGLRQDAQRFAVATSARGARLLRDWLAGLSAKESEGSDAAASRQIPDIG